MNDAGKVVGNSKTTGDAATHAFIYIGTPGAGGAMVDLDVWLDANNPTEGAKWTLTSANDISNTDWITGNGTYDPDGPGGVAAAQRAFLLDGSGIVVPEPGTIGVLGLGAAAISLSRRRRR
jgi:probable HAF family extracellular repeat protein